MDSVSDPHNKTSITAEQVIIFLLVEGLNFSLKYTTSVRHDKAMHNKVRYANTVQHFKNGAS